MRRDRPPEPWHSFFRDIDEAFGERMFDDEVDSVPIEAIHNKDLEIIY